MYEYNYGWVDGWIDGWMDGWMDEWMDRWMDGPTTIHSSLQQEITGAKFLKKQKVCRWQHELLHGEDPAVSEETAQNRKELFFQFRDLKQLPTPSPPPPLPIPGRWMGGGGGGSSSSFIFMFLRILLYRG